MTAVTRHGSGGPWEAAFGYSRVVAAGPWVLSAGCTATVDGVVGPVGDAYGQAVRAFGIALDALAAAGATPADVVRTRMYLVDAGDAEAVGRAHAELFGAVRPAATLLVVARLLHPDHLVEVEVEAYRPVGPPVPAAGGPGPRRVPDGPGPPRAPDGPRPAPDGPRPAPAAGGRA